MITLSGLNQFLDSLEEGILFLDRRRHVVAINQAAKTILGREEDQVIDRLCPSMFQGTACARNCEQGGGCKLMSKASGEKLVQDLVVARPTANRCRYACGPCASRRRPAWPITP